MHPTETEKAQPCEAVKLAAHEIMLYAERCRPHRMNQFTVEDIIQRASIPDPASAVPALVGALERAVHIEEARLQDRVLLLYFKEDRESDAECCAIRDNLDAYCAALALVKGGKR